MDKIILLDWDGPVSNSRTWKMPNSVDPVAVQLLNDLTVAGWKTILTSTIRKHYRGPEGKGKATDFMKRSGFFVQWYEPLWCSDPDYNSHRRHLEVAYMMQNNEFPEDAVFLVIDDEKLPTEFLNTGRMVQIHAQAHSGIDYLDISNAYRIIDMNTPELEAEFGEPEDAEDDDDWGEDE